MKDARACPLSSVSLSAGCSRHPAHPTLAWAKGSALGSRDEGCSRMPPPPLALSLQLLPCPALLLLPDLPLHSETAGLAAVQGPFESTHPSHRLLPAPSEVYDAWNDKHISESTCDDYNIFPLKPPQGAPRTPTHSTHTLSHRTSHTLCFMATQFLAMLTRTSTTTACLICLHLHVLAALRATDPSGHDDTPYGIVHMSGISAMLIPYNRI